MKKDETYDKGYGVFTDISKGCNDFFGDKSGRTVSLRTAHGFKKTFGLNVTDKTAEQIIHSGMILLAYHLFTKKGDRTVGFLFLIGLIALYQNGK